MWTLLLAVAAAADLAIVHATALPISGPPIADATLLVTGGKIEALGAGLPVPPGTRTVIDAKGRYLMPGIIDVHSHMGVYPWPGANAHSDGNEATDPFTPRVWAGDSFHVEDPALARARAGGVTTIQVLPGSANLIGGQSDAGQPMHRVEETMTIAKWQQRATCGRMCVRSGKWVLGR
jgi:imidazolonepropionase-like amidohydrolase